MQYEIDWEMDQIGSSRSGVKMVCKFDPWRRPSTAFRLTLLPAPLQSFGMSFFISESFIMKFRLSGDIVIERFQSKWSLRNNDEFRVKSKKF